MGISYVTATNQSRANSTSLAKALPSGIASGDGVFAFVCARGTLTPPAGWTSVQTAANAWETLHLYRKDTVTSSDSGVSHSWNTTIASIAVTYVVVRADVEVVVRGTGTNSIDAAGNTSITIASVTADRDPEIVLVGADTSYITGSVTSPTPPAGMTLVSGASLANYQVMAAYQIRNGGETTSGTFIVYPPGGVSDNDINTISVRLADRRDEPVMSEGVTLELTDVTSGMYSATISDTAYIYSALGDILQDALADGFTLSDVVENSMPTSGILTDGIEITPLVLTLYRQSASLADQIDINDLLVDVMGVLLRDGLRLGETYAPALSFAQILSDAVALSEQVRTGQPVSLADAITLTLVAQVSASARIIDALQLTDALAPAVTYGLSLSESATMLDTITRFFGAGLTDAITASDALAGTYRPAAALADTVTITPVAAPQMVLRVTASDTVEITAEEAVGMLYSGVLTDGVEIATGYIAPDGSFTAWAMNTATGAVTEYDNYVFNSFLPMGHKYLGASTNGLYELNGDTDDGTDIVARIKSGLLQFGGTHLSRLKGAYIATRGEEDFVLRIETGHGQTYDYAVSTRSMRSTRVHMGKGQRARYFSFELISAGGDFDLDTLEFVPIVVQRRV